MAQTESKGDIITQVYELIQQKSGKIRSADLYEMLGKKDEVRFAISRLTCLGKIARIRGFGEMGIEYYYQTRR